MIEYGGLRAFMDQPSVGRPLHADDLTGIMREIFENSIPPSFLVMTLETKAQLEAAMEVWRKAQAEIELRAHIMRVNAGARRRQQRRSK